MNATKLIRDAVELIAGVIVIAAVAVAVHGYYALGDFLIGGR